MNHKQTIKATPKLLKPFLLKIDKGAKLTQKELFALTELERVNVLLSGELDPGSLISTERVRRVLSVSNQTLTMYRKIGFPESTNTAVNACDVIKWFRNKWIDLRDNSGGDDMGAGGSPALERYRIARAEQEEIKLQLQKKDLVSIDDIIDVVVDILTSVWSQIVIYRNKLPAILYLKSALQIKNILSKETDSLGNKIQSKVMELSKQKADRSTRKQAVKPKKKTKK